MSEAAEREKQGAEIRKQLPEKIEELGRLIGLTSMLCALAPHLCKNHAGNDPEFKLRTRFSLENLLALLKRSETELETAIEAIKAGTD